MNLQTPKISVVMPAYNASKYIRDAIQSILNQVFDDFELIIVDDGSTDETREIIRTFSDVRIRLIEREHLGIPSSLNEGIEQARAPLIARMDTDDISLPNRFKIQFDFLEQNPDYAIVGSDAEYMDMNGMYIFTHRMPARSSEEISDTAERMCPFIHSSVIFRKEAVLDAGGYDPRAAVFQDHVLMVRVLKKYKAINLGQVLLKVRLNPESVSIDERWRPKRFHRIRAASVSRGKLEQSEGHELLEILHEQSAPNIKEGSYYALVAKKFLWNNYQPRKARTSLLQSIRICPQRLDNYFLLMMSFLPAKLIAFIYNTLGSRISKSAY